MIEDGGVRARVIAGSDFGVKSPVGMLSEWLYAEVVLAAGATAPLDPDQEERALPLCYRHLLAQCSDHVRSVPELLEQSVCVFA